MQLADQRRELVAVQVVPAFSGVQVQAGVHVLSEDEVVEGSAAGSPHGDGFDRLLEFRCARYLYSPAEDTFLPIPGLAPDFAARLHRIATSKSIQGKGPAAQSCAHLRQAC